MDSRVVSQCGANASVGRTSARDRNRHAGWRARRSHPFAGDDGARRDPRGDASMTLETHSKVQARHLKRHAYLYIRQSSLRQVLEHTESTQRQYNLKQRAIALGWAHDQIVVV